MKQETTINAMNPRYQDEVYSHWYLCPECNEVDIAPHYKYCPMCGVRIIWENELQAINELFQYRPEVL